MNLKIFELFLKIISLIFMVTHSGFARTSSQTYLDTPHGLVPVDAYLQNQVKQLMPKALKGDPEAQCSLGSLYSNNGKEKEGMKWFQKSALQGNAWPARMLGFYYEKKKDYKETLNWRLKGAEGGDPYLLMDISNMYKEGEGVDRSEKVAKEWALKAKQTESNNLNRLKDKALKGDVKAQLEMATIYSTANNLFFKKNDEEAIKWWRMAAAQNNSEGQFLLGLSYERGNGVKKDIKEAFNWYMKAAQQGEETAEFQIGCMYLHGVGVQRDDTEAARWFLKGAKQGDVYSSYKIGTIYKPSMNLQITPQEQEKYFEYGCQRGDSGDFYRPEMLKLFNPKPWWHFW